MRLTARAPGKVNLCLFLGPVRADGRHELVTLFESVSVADSVVVETLAGGASDEVACPGVEGPNLVEGALAGLRARGWDAPPLRVTIEKRIPVAGGMGGGSADAAAMLRIAPEFAPVSGGAVDAVAAELGADVPSQVVPGMSIGTGAGEVVERIGPIGPHALVIVPQDYELSTPEVFREADRLGLGREQADLVEWHRELLTAAGDGAYLLGNDLEAAALSLRPSIGEALEAIRGAGIAHAMVSGSGPTVFGLLTGEDAFEHAEAVATGLAGRYPGATAATPVSEEFGAPRGS
jgi:4-diphosphocytidyl-2-C-methyl-D-erythritol kinase